MGQWLAKLSIQELGPQYVLFCFYSSSLLFVAGLNMNLGLGFGFCFCERLQARILEPITRPFTVLFLLRHGSLYVIEKPLPFLFPSAHTCPFSITFPSILLSSLPLAVNLTLHPPPQSTSSPSSSPSPIILFFFFFHFSSQPTPNYLPPTRLPPGTTPSINTNSNQLTHHRKTPTGTHSPSRPSRHPHERNRSSVA